MLTLSIISLNKKKSYAVLDIMYLCKHGCVDCGISEGKMNQTQPEERDLLSEFGTRDTDESLKSLKACKNEVPKDHGYANV